MSLTRWLPAPHFDAANRFLAYWVLWVTLGAVAGALLPALAWYLFAGTTASVPALILAGAGQGIVLGWTQGTLLSFGLPGLSRSRWVGATAAGTAAAWFVGLLPVEWADVWQRWPAAGQLTAAVLLGGVLLSAIGLAQAIQLRPHLPGALRWLAGTIAAWLAGAGVFLLVAPPLWQPGQPVMVSVLIGVIAGILALVTVSLVTGLVLLRLLRRPPRPPRTDRKS